MCLWSNDNKRRMLLMNKQTWYAAAGNVLQINNLDKTTSTVSENKTSRFSGHNFSKCVAKSPFVVRFPRKFCTNQLEEFLLYVN